MWFWINKIAKNNNEIKINDSDYVITLALFFCANLSDWLNFEWMRNWKLGVYLTHCGALKIAISSSFCVYYVNYMNFLIYAILMMAAKILVSTFKIPPKYDWLDFSLIKLLKVRNLTTCAFFHPKS